MHFEDYLTHEKDFSVNTFGPGKRTKGILNHIRKELVEVQEQPEDIEEWFDVLMVVCDGALRMGFTPVEISDALMVKLKKNLKRTWPDYRNYTQDEAIEHVRETWPEGIHPRGTILRYGDGPSSLMRVDRYMRIRGVYGGRHCMGGNYCAGSKRIELGTEKDILTYRSYLK